MSENNMSASGAMLGYVRVSTDHQSLDQQHDTLVAAGVRPDCTYRDVLTGTSRREQRPGLAALLDYAGPGDTITVVGIDRLGRDAAEVMTTIRDLRDRDIVLRSLREGIDTSNAAGRMIAGVLASLAELELELGREHRRPATQARKVRGLRVGRKPALTPDQQDIARRMHETGERVAKIADMLGVHRTTIYRLLAGTDSSTTIAERMRLAK